MTEDCNGGMASGNVAASTLSFGFLRSTPATSRGTPSWTLKDAVRVRAILHRNAAKRPKACREYILGIFSVHVAAVAVRTSSGARPYSDPASLLSCHPTTG